MRSRVPVQVFILSGVVIAGSTAVLAQEEEASPAAVPRTPWGHPDLQGVWDYRTITPMQRPREFGDRAYYTDEEVAELEGNAADRMENAPEEITPGLVHPSYATDPGRFVDESRRTSLIVDPPNGRVPPLTPEAEAAQAAARGGRGRGQAADSYLDRSLLERCITQGFPRSIMPTLYNNNIKIVQSPEHVAVIHEMVHETRIVPLDGSDYSGVRGWIGESRGHWEGDTLVIETKNFDGQVSYQGSSENLVVTERFTRIGPDRIGFSMTLQDDTVWTQPWTVEYTMRPTDGDLYEYACHEGNYGLANMLQYARDEEAAAAAAN